MRTSHALSLLAASVFAISACGEARTGMPTGVAKSGFNVPAAGFDELGYNDVAGIFNGLADGTDGVLDGKVWGDPTFANDHLVMKWNKAWPDGDGAWTMNEWNGQVPGGSGEVWHYKIVRTPAPCAGGSVLPDGSICIWDHFAITMSQGTVANEHFWQVHATPTGYGVKR